MQNDGKPLELQQSSIKTLQQNDNTFSYTDSIVALKTPVLFSTDYGIHIRHTVFNQTLKSSSSSSAIITNSATPPHQYKVFLCDLENFRGGRQIKSIGLTPDTTASTSTTGQHHGQSSK